jgi:hypothetical protein
MLTFRPIRVAAAVIALGACSGPVPSESESTVAEAPFTTASFGTWEIGVDHVGPLTIDLTSPELADLVGVTYPDAYTDFGEECAMGQVSKDGPLADVFWVAATGGGHGRVDTYLVRPFHYDGPFPRTVDGLGIGSTLDEIQTVYGDSLEFFPHEYQEGVTRVVAREGEMAIVFDVPLDSGAFAITVGRYPQVVWPEGCA